MQSDTDNLKSVAWESADFEDLFKQFVSHFDKKDFRLEGLRYLSALHASKYLHFFSSNDKNKYCALKLDVSVQFASPVFYTQLRDTEQTKICDDYFSIF